MTRFSHLDTDEERLPEGMVRIAYDADTQVYTYKDTEDGSYWEGAPGCQYGKLFRVGPTAPLLESVTVDDVAEGDKPEPALNEGTWEPTDAREDLLPRKNSLVRQFINKLISRRSQSSVTRSAPPEPDTLDIQPSDKDAQDDGRRESNAEPSSPVQVETASTWQDGAPPSRSSPGSDV